mmetsp:Transcript_54909/g.134593  ORF Transcript_54909/g.134593 Transcript_54909/m.134593 type:complete len:275 (-) Transcript_54909:224-1048(-)
MRFSASSSELTSNVSNSAPLASSRRCSARPSFLALRMPVASVMNNSIFGAALVLGLAAVPEPLRFFFFVVACFSSSCSFFLYFSSTSFISSSKSSKPSTLLLAGVFALVVSLAVAVVAAAAVSSSSALGGAAAAAASSAVAVSSSLNKSSTSSPPSATGMDVAVAAAAASSSSCSSFSSLSRRGVVFAKSSNIESISSTADLRILSRFSSSVIISSSFDLTGAVASLVEAAAAFLSSLPLPSSSSSSSSSSGSGGGGLTMGSNSPTSSMPRHSS